MQTKLFESDFFCATDKEENIENSELELEYSVTCYLIRVPHSAHKTWKLLPKFLASTHLVYKKTCWTTRHCLVWFCTFCFLVLKVTRHVTHEVETIRTTDAFRNANSLWRRRSHTHLFTFMWLLVVIGFILLRLKVSEYNSIYRSPFFLTFPSRHEKWIQEIVLDNNLKTTRSGLGRQPWCWRY